MIIINRLFGALACIFLATTYACSQIPSDRKLDVPYVPTHESIVDEMLNMAEVNGEDILYDLGSGDGRILITAAERFGTRGVGVDLKRAGIPHHDVPLATADDAPSRAALVNLDRWVSDLRVRRVAGGHWLMRSHPDEVTRCVQGLVDQQVTDESRSAADIEAGEPGDGQVKTGSEAT
jgi:hypothetical protein